SRSPADIFGVVARGEDLRAIEKWFPGIVSRTSHDFSDLLRFCENLSEGWAMRYHVLLAMLRANVPVVPLVCDEKIRSLSIEAGIIGNGETKTVFAKPKKASTAFFAEHKKRFEAMRNAFYSYIRNE
ncbi:hypothetical protein HYY75_13355, partial [bacterium]|nr:hypothetical protein [bacterium]